MIKVRLLLPAGRFRRFLVLNAGRIFAGGLLAFAAAILFGPVRTADGIPRVNARSAVLMDPVSGNLLFAKNPDARIFPASTAKILTGLIAVEEGDPEEWITIGPEIRLAPRDSSRAGLRVGDRIRMRDLIGGLLLPSGNDAAYAIAVHIGRSRTSAPSLSPGRAVSRFVDLMNNRARRIGARQSVFTTPDGYDDNRQFTSARDMALIAREAMAHPLFRKIAGSAHHLPEMALSGPDALRASRRNDPRARFWENRNKLLDASSPYHFAGATGIKTGHTAEAGYCLVSSARRNGRELISVVMHSSETGVWTDSIALLNFGFRSPGRLSAGAGT